jgi:hypothetical protein
MQFVTTRLVAERGEVGARAKRPACPEQNRCAPRRLGFESLERGAECVGGGTVDGVTARWPFEHDRGDRTVCFEPHVFAEVLSEAFR